MKKIRLEATNMQGKVQTVLGLIDPKEAGFTLPHEHLIHDLPKKVFLQSQTKLLPMLKSKSLTLENLKWIRQYPYCFEDNLEFCDEATRSAVKEEMQFLKKCCNKATVVDNCSIGLRAKDHAKFLKEIATETGVNVVMGTGFYVAGAQTTSTLNMTQEDMADKMRDDILKGVDSTEVKCGVIGEIGCSYPILPFEKTCLYASAAVQRETGCPVILHPGRNRGAPEEILRLFQEAGGKGAKAVMSHLDRTFKSYEHLVEFACLGSYCEFDLFGIEVSHYQLDEEFDMPSDAQRIAFLRDLLLDGYGDKIVVSHDVHTKHRLEKFGGHGYSHLYVTVLNKMLYRGFSDYDVKKIFYTNPQNWLTFA